MLEILIAAILGAAAFRIRGSDQFFLWTGRGHTSSVAFWALVMTAVALWAHGLRWQLPLLAPLFWIGGKFGWWGSCINMGRDALGNIDPDEWLHDAIWALIRGAVFTAPAAAWLAYLGLPWLPLALSGLLCPVAYEIGHRLPIRTRVFGVSIVKGPEVGECLYGAPMAAALIIGVALQ